MSDPVTPPPATPPVQTTEELLQHVNEQMYKQNAELAIRNKTLSILRNLYEITISSLNVSEVTQKIVDTLVNELSFTAALISLVDEKQQFLHPVAITNTPEVTNALATLGTPFLEIQTPLTTTGNKIVYALTQGSKQITTNFLDIITPLGTQAAADAIQQTTGIKTIIIYPVRLGARNVGALSIGIAKEADDLSRAERESIEEIIELIAIAIDRAQLYESIARANEELKELDKLKDEFVSVASHELKSPMNAVKNYLWLAQKKGDESPEKMHEYLGVAYAATQRLILLVNDLLNVSRIESDRVTLNIVPLSLKSLVDETIAVFAPQANEKKLGLTSTIDATTLVMGDDAKVRETLSNFISNAIKYTPTGSVSISALPAENNHIKISVKDTGLGISPADQAKLFQKFSRVNSSYKELATVEGTGLGLYICKKFVELMGGTIGVESAPGSGSTFFFTLPVATQPLPSPTPAV